MSMVPIISWRWRPGPKTPSISLWCWAPAAKPTAMCRIAAQELGQEPCLLLGMRLGEGSGCPVMFQILRAACAVMDGMATFPEAAIEDDYLTPIRAQDSFTVTP